jgi:hypothetical protein
MHLVGVMNHSSSSAPRRPSGWFYLLALVGLPLLGGAISFAIAFATVPSRVESMPRVIMPGQTTVHLEEGDQTAFYEPRSVVDGRAYVGGELYGVTCAMASPDGQPVTIDANPGARVSYEFGDFAGSSSFTFHAPVTGDYQIRCDSTAAAQPPIVFAFASGLGRSILQALLPFGFAAIAGIALAVVIYRRRNRHSPTAEFPAGRVVSLPAL